MATRLEKLQESLKREERRTDSKRLKKASEYLRLALETLNHSFHDEEIEIYTSSITSQLAEFAQQMGVVAENK